MLSSHPSDAPHPLSKKRVLWRNQNAAPKSTGKHKATSREPARTSVSSYRTFVPLLNMEGLCILLPKLFQRERTFLMNSSESSSYCSSVSVPMGFRMQGRREIGNPLRWRNLNSRRSMYFRRHSHEGTLHKNSNHGSFGFDDFKRSEGPENFGHHKQRRRLFGSLPIREQSSA